MDPVSVRCCIAGGGPAGMMLGLLLARAGVECLVLEKHADFLRDFRGDTVHPSTLEVIAELGLFEAFLALPHQKVAKIHARIAGVEWPVADFSRLRTRGRYIAFVPQWDFLDFLAERARGFPSFDLRMQAEVTGLIEDAGRVVGLRARTPQGALEVRCDLVVAADGRNSLVRERAGLEIQELGAPIDVLWFRLSRLPGDPEGPRGCFAAGRILAMIDRGTYWQCGYVIPKGALEGLRARGLDALRASVAELSGFEPDRVVEPHTWDEVSVLTVRVDRLRRWHRPGLVCIGDAAHAMSPVGGVGINLAIQDAVAAANALAEPLREGQLEPAHLAAVQRRRELPTRVTQWLQVQVQERVLARVLSRQEPLRPPLAVRLISRLPLLQRLIGRAIGLGVRPEHVRSPQAASPDRAARARRG